MVELKDRESLLASMRSRVQEQGDVVRSLKSRNAPEAELKIALAELKARKKLLEEKEAEMMPTAVNFDRAKLEDLLKQKFFYDQSFAIYGGIQGLYDYGPMGCAMKANLISAWRQHFILEDQLLEVDCSMLTPAPVLQASGHVERFTDLMVKDVKTGECFRADHLVKANLEAMQKNKKTTAADKQEMEKLLIQLDNFGKKELDDIIRRYGMKAPVTNNELTEPQEFNLMFATQLGPTGNCKGYLRPETAQGIFVNFQRLLHFNQGRIPFGAAQIGSAFRNEISPRSGLIRVREFAMAEIEYFVDPKHKDHAKFEGVRNVSMSIYSACDQMDGRAPRQITIGEAVDQGIVANQTLGYFMARIHQFLLLIGLDPSRLRFRQHLSNEMAHYACDCWDAECQTSYGWIECVGCADRSCYDLSQHARATGTRLVAEKQLPEPRMVRVCECVPNKQLLGKTYRGQAKAVVDRLSALKQDEAIKLKEDLDVKGETSIVVDGTSYVVDKNMVQIKDYESKVHVEEIVPNVIEPSFGLGRILYAVFEHSFRVREGDEQRTYLSVPPVLAPYKCSVLPLSNHSDFIPFVRQLSAALTRSGVSHRIDESSGSIGRRYARTDQIAIPYGITVDFDTVNKRPASATLRERDSMKQIRVPLDELPSLVSDLSNGILDWTEAQAKYPTFEQQETGTRQEISASQVRRDDSESPFVPLSEQETKDLISSPTGKSEPERMSEFIESSIPISPTNLTNGHAPVPSGTMSPMPGQGNREVHHAIGDQKSDKSGTKRGHKHSHGRKSDKLDASNVNVGRQSEHEGEKAPTGFSTTPGTRLPSCWSDCVKSIRKHYEGDESEKRNELIHKKMGTDITTVTRQLELEESRNIYSGYEADQEDNVVNKSTTLGQLSPLTGITPEVLEELPHSPSPNAIDSISTPERASPKIPIADSLSPINAKSSELPNHGLFVGSGWPGQSVSTSVEKKQEAQATESAHEPFTPSWQSTMAQVYERSCEPDMWEVQLCNTESMAGITPVPYDRSSHPPVQLPIQDSLDKAVLEKECNQTSLELISNHGLFVGSGWPATKQAKETMKGKSSSESIKPDDIQDSKRAEQSSVSIAREKISDEPSPVVQFDDPLFGDFSSPLSDDILNVPVDSNMTILHTEPAPEPFWKQSDDAVGKAEAETSRGLSEQQQQESISHNPVEASNSEEFFVESGANGKSKDDSRNEKLAATLPEILTQTQTVSGNAEMDSLHFESAKKSVESPEPAVDVVQFSEKSEEPGVRETTCDSHDTGTLKSKNKRRKHKKKKTQS